MQLTLSSNPITQAKGWKLLEPPDFPEGLRYLWDWHIQLRMGVCEMMTWTDLVAWGMVQALSPESREVEALFYLDAIYRNPPKE